MSIKLKLLYVGLAILFIATLWPSEPSEEKVASIRIWNAHVNEQGQLDVLGVVLGKTTLKEAEVILHTQSERALFIDIQSKEHKSDTLEAYFPTSPDRAKLFLELDASEELFTDIKKRGYKATLFPSGNAKVAVAPEQTADVEATIVKSLTYVPPISLTPSLVEKNFGKADRKLNDGSGNIHILYPALGLDVVIAREGKPLLQFVAPENFDRLLELLDVDDAKEMPK
ncbi:hypothetical protein ACFL2V_00685 [Pseudomonadota bacterium]